MLSVTPSNPNIKGYTISRFYSNVVKMLSAGSAALMATSVDHTTEQKLNFMGYAIGIYAICKAADTITFLVEDHNNSRETRKSLPNLVKDR